MSAMSVSSTKPMTSDDVIDDVTDSRQPSVQGLHSPSSTVPPPSLKPGLWVCVCVWGDVSAVYVWGGGVWGCFGGGGGVRVCVG